MHLVILTVAPLEVLITDHLRCMTTTAGDPALELQYPKAFAEAFAPTLASGGKVFRYVHITGAAVERDQTKVLWMKSDVRKIKVRHYLLGSEIFESHCMVVLGAANDLIGPGRDADDRIRERGRYRQTLADDHCKARIRCDARLLRWRSFSYVGRRVGFVHQIG